MSADSDVCWLGLMPGDLEEDVTRPVGFTGPPDGWDDVLVPEVEQPVMAAQTHPGMPVRVRWSGVYIHRPTLDRWLGRDR